jgi:hypothetical protein
MNERYFLAAALVTSIGCSYPAVTPPGVNHPASVEAASGLLPELVLEDDSPLRGGGAAPEPHRGEPHHHQ